MTRHPFISGLPMVARTSFRFNGRQFHPGDAFPPDLANERRMRQMWASRHIECVPPGAPMPPTIQPRAQAPSEPTEVFFVVEHRGFGRYEVVELATSAVALKVKGDKAKADAEAARLNETRRGAGGPGANGGELPASAAPGPSPSSAAA